MRPVYEFAASQQFAASPAEGAEGCVRAAIEPVSFLRPTGYARVKRLVDFCGALLLLVFASPVLALAALAIKLDSKGPVLYSQARVGLRGKIFTVTKFRSMRTDAEHEGTPVWATKNDSRVTRVGRFLRKSRLDEFPQLVAVLRGDMSLVGPRPEREYFVKQLSAKLPEYDLRHLVRPGLTGLAQVRYQYGSTEEDARIKLGFDLHYVRNQALRLDLALLLETVVVVITGRGAH